MATNRFYPRYAQIDAITNALNAVVTFTANHDFIDGEIISFRVTSNFGMFQINNKNGKVISSTADTVTVNIDTTTWDAFTTAMLNEPGTTPPVCVPCCSGTIPSSNPATIVIADAFDNRRVN